ncbi:MAG: hypothetical protein AB7T03_04485 [Bacilli bacterium]
MKKFFALIITLFLMFSVSTVKAEEEIIVYPFDSITITSAFHFQVAVTEAVSAESFLYGHVNAGENLDVYVGYLDFESGGSSVGESKILIITNEDDEDIIRWVINGSSLQGNGFYLDQFSSHILVDPNIGIRKDLTVPLLMAYVTYDSDLNIGYLKDNLNANFDSVLGTYAFESDLSIVISINTEA